MVKFCASNEGGQVVTSACRAYGKQLFQCLISLPFKTSVRCHLGKDEKANITHSLRYSFSKTPNGF